MSLPEVGQILAGKYRMERVLGQGGMGVVVQATHVQLEERVAMKFLLPEYASHPEASTRFLREARAAVKIKSEHVARVVDVGALESGAPYMVMEFLEGRDLSQVLEKDGPLSVSLAVDYVLQACEAIAEAHAAGIVHRDLKPANLFLTQRADRSAVVKVLDFGISKTTVPSDSGPDMSLTKTSAMMGSPLYMSPEQMRSSRDANALSDQWSLGAILYELVTGSTPFNAESLPELCAKILSEAPRPLSQLRAQIPAAFGAVVLRTLAKNPLDRYPSISELALALSQFGPPHARTSVERISRVMEAAGLSTSRPGMEMDVGEAVATTLSTWGQTTARVRSGKGLVIVVSASAFLLAAGVLAFTLSRQTPTPEPAVSARSAAASSPATVLSPPAATPVAPPVMAPNPTVVATLAGAEPPTAPSSIAAPVPSAVTATSAAASPSPSPPRATNGRVAPPSRASVSAPRPKAQPAPAEAKGAPKPELFDDRK